MHSDKALIIHKRKHAHDELAVHAVSDATMARDGLSKVFDFESSFQAGGEEAAKGRYERGEGGENLDVEVNRSNGDESWEFGGGPEWIAG